jgi:signal transduction histidine kinase
MAITGAMNSPMLPIIGAVVILPTAMYGCDRYANELAVMLVACLAVLMFIPPAVAGPPVEVFHHAAIVASTFVWGLVASRAVMTRIAGAAAAADGALHDVREAQVADAEAHTTRLRHVASRIAHELKNPLAAIKSLVQLVARGASHARLAPVLDQISRVQELVAEYLSFARPVDRRGRRDVPDAAALRHERNRMLLTSPALVHRILAIGGTVIGTSVVLMGHAGLAGGRVAAICAGFVVFAAFQRTVAFLRSRPGLTQAGAQRGYLAHVLAGQVWSVYLVVLTGGLRSPLLTAFAANLVIATMFEGIGMRRALPLAAAPTGWVIVMAFLPGWLVGPPITGWHHDVVTLMTLVWAIVLLRTFTAAVSRASDRARAAVDEARAERLRDAETMRGQLVRIAAGVADELVPPLEAMHAAVGAELAQVAAAGDERTTRRLEVVAGELARMRVIAGEYLSATRPLEDLEPEPVDLATLAGESAAVVAGRAEHGQVALELATRGARVIADPRRLREALLNVLSNALDATPAGGKVRVETVPTDGGGATVTVVDSGRGMSRAELDRIGTSFFTTRKEGTGLGVVLVKGVVSQHGGTVAYTSDPGRGTRVTITLPPRPPS